MRIRLLFGQARPEIQPEWPFIALAKVSRPSTLPIRLAGGVVLALCSGFQAQAAPICSNPVATAHSNSAQEKSIFWFNFAGPDIAQGATSTRSAVLPDGRTISATIAVDPTSGAGLQVLGSTSSTRPLGMVMDGGSPSNFSSVSPTLRGNLSGRSTKFTVTFSEPLNVVIGDGEDSRVGGSPAIAEGFTVTSNGGVWETIDTFRASSVVATGEETSTASFFSVPTNTADGNGGLYLVLSRQASSVSVVTQTYSAGRTGVAFGILLPDGGDAPSRYGNAFAESDIVNPGCTAFAQGAPYLGSVPSDGNFVLGGEASDADDRGAPRDDEDAISSFPPLRTNQTSYALNIPVSSGEGSTVGGWIDFDRNGVFDAAEFAKAIVTGGSANLTWALGAGGSPLTSTAGQTYSRFRVFSGDLLASDSTGLKSNGEVEDYSLLIKSSTASLDDSVSGISGQSGQSDVLNVLSNDTIEGVAATSSNAVLSLAPGSAVPAGITFNLVTGSVGVEPATSSGTYSFNYRVCNLSDLGDCGISAVSVTIAPSVDLSITKSNGVPVVVNGAVVNYTVIVSNSGPDPAVGALVTDVVGNGLTCPSNNAVTISGDGVPAGSFTIANLTGAGIALGTLAAGQSATLSYSCQVN